MNLKQEVIPVSYTHLFAGNSFVSSVPVPILFQNQYVVVKHPLKKDALLITVSNRVFFCIVSKVCLNEKISLKKSLRLNSSYIQVEI